MSDTVETLLATQSANIKQLHKAVINHSKCSYVKRTIAYFNTRLGVVNDLFGEILRIHKQLIASEGSIVNDYIESDIYSEAEEAFITLKAELLEGVQGPQPPVQPPAQPLAAQAVENGAPPLLPQNNDIRLPTISIPLFNGEYNSWPSFKISFEHLVANNGALTNLQRLHYLKSSLTGDAKRLVQNYKILDANYQAAWEKLELRYGNKKFLINNHLKAFINQPSRSKETASHIRELIDVTIDHWMGSYPHTSPH